MEILKKIMGVILLVVFMAACRDKEGHRVDEERFLFGTYIKISIFHGDRGEARAALNKAFEEIERIDRKFNSHWEGSVIDRLNKDPRNGVEIDEEGLMLFEEVRKMYELTGGRFDISIEPLVDLWGFGKEKPMLPTREEIEETLERIDYTRVRIEDGWITLEEPLEEIDTGAFLKGYATARAKDILRREGIESAFITTISSIETLGPKPDGPWRIGIQNPENPGEILDIVNLDGQAMGISGDYQTFVEIDEKRYHHILDPTTGYPVEDKKLVAVICADALDGDLYSTAFFLMEIDEVMEYVERMADIEVFIVDGEGEVIMSSGFEKYL